MSDRSLFSAQDYAALAAIVFRPDYPGNASARGVVEAPGGDPAARDTGKRYSHVAVKYIDQMGQGTGKTTLHGYLKRAHKRAREVAAVLGVPPAFMPDFRYSALRVLEYPPGSGSHTHTDFDLFTLNLWRNMPTQVNSGELPEAVRAVEPKMHIGELGEIIGLGPATPHEVAPARGLVQHSIVYFAMPAPEAVLPGGRGTVGEWLKERLARSRYEAEGK